ncbi:3-keto-L-gulonate-6-phosphate decarboxylase ulaD [Sebaldella termitidis]|jgi:3-dehydro-L-gulonate-6-phosphate decarboxylase|uniref:3-dehydro-L-gulonate-6-phosphate decarboxylase n=1 Tax=Sebaldella termitidis (strain ATCC 33386 / NCTC 11300) TaxID=526218 RepID=D1AJV5_SEBTE|nr:3-keto-L-gulonate-6-phosphate decarboxylase UlaD [Sebaldella termitidis]ACZ07012.1 3-dehydro-L-gulonate-6-phosphate decarboxylase [Sebaldella termitidis ATCC 33386]ACZ07030.1 3-dehydro-L-gulonate-6-phosphate decarboxylase [Sebaldella termitidis ATCC 33386]SUI22302.1 3-keto-L-gulonate-6-phosphate decarboxylase ulaD [Sebaldella termitidis]SUI22320.1 3-keto-L-gulonate-6-phosphate decarboxylase ulaD [Sebaldella termitidis]
MAKPLLQIALDNNTLSDAIRSISQVGHEVDIIEAGTILCLAEGMEAVRCLRALYPNKIILADTKCADAGGTVAKNCADAGADWMTVICSATIPTMKAALKEVKDLQVELYGDWTFEHAKQWKEAGLSQAVYHQSRDALLAGETWGEKDLNKIRKLVEMGFKVSVTGGLEKETLKLFKGIDVYTFIAGRGIREASDPAQAAREFKEEIDKYWD